MFKEEDIPWKSIWILKDNSNGRKVICELPESNPIKKVTQEPSEKKEIEGPCESQWFQEILRKHKDEGQGKDRWWIKGRDEKTINDMLKHEPLWGAGISKKLKRSEENGTETTGGKSLEKDLTVEELRGACQVKERSFFNRRIEIMCSGE
ncbi:hypothetical protein [Mycoplasma suis]|uniref:Uncharacterized protein n=1 Tax=Mycoplasma suis (strain Illinois) TaxID=768700 RepID=F0QRS4_MYCSL|nr:hypothetical protein [Mycoplasma suis]ADX98194.1 hypothetical protein MSU_0663 [Mycoplasma suis str. Illinois]